MAGKRGGWLALDGDAAVAAVAVAPGAAAVTAAAAVAAAGMAVSGAAADAVVVTAGDVAGGGRWSGVCACGPGGSRPNGEEELEDGFFRSPCQGGGGEPTAAWGVRRD